MIRVVCSNCGAIYVVASAKLPNVGQAITCANCDHSWPYSPAPQNTPEVSQVKKRKGPPGRVHGQGSSLRSILLQVIIMVPLLFFFSSSFQNSIPYKFRKIYRWAELYDTSHIRLLQSHVKVIHTNSDGTMTLKVSCTLENETTEERFVPGLHFVFYDKNKERVFAKKLEVAKYELIVGQQKRRFEQTISGVPPTAEALKIRAGNAFEILFH
ncbi:zinc-ribbon domain-containing protein [Anaplasma platys]|nr:zinc-ribbon domain-containing protein [Anaplasma platys]